MGFPKSICAAPNEVICHGIPDSRILEEGDIVSFDVSIYADGVFGDNCGTVAHCRNRDAFTLVPGHVFTIEPMLTERSPELYVADDGWTVVTRDGGRAAQFEHMVLVTDDGHEVLTLPE
ncbi:metalloendopeptidase [Aureococcus anophagefferens]|nr:metalloendopeptidase [Aureococcus anophagefferens]